MSTKKSLEARDMTSLRKHIQKGFTVVEMLVAISVIAILLAFAGPTLTNSGANSDIKQATDQVAQAFRAAKMTARVTNTTVFIILNTSDNRICFAASNIDCETDTNLILDGSPPLAPIVLPTNVTVGGDTTSFSFNAMGQISTLDIITLTSDTSSHYASSVAIDSGMGHVTTTCCTAQEES